MRPPRPSGATIGLFLGACLALLAPARAAGPVAGFCAADLAIVNEPYALQLPATGADHEVTWGDGAVERVAAARAAAGPVTHVYATVGVAFVTVKARRGDGPWVPVGVDVAATVNASRPVFFVGGAVAAGAAFPAVLAGPADSFSVECRVRLDDPAADQVIFASAQAGPGACQFRIRDRSLSFELAGAGAFAVPLENLLALGTWHHLAVTYDRAPLFPRSNQVRFFIDGRPAGAGTIPADDAGAVACAAAVAGARGFKGGIEALAVYDRLLFPLAIREHAALLAGRAASLAVTVAHSGASAVAVDLPVIARTIDVALDPDPRADNGPTLRKALSAAQAGTRVRVVSTTGAGRAFHVRSLVEAPKWAALIIEDKADVELDGNGSTLIFADKVARYLLIDRCRRIAVRNLAFDLDPAYARVAVYAKLVDVDPAKQAVTARLVNGRGGSPDPLIPRRASFWRWRPHDPRTLRATADSSLFDSGSYAQRPAAGPGVIRFTLKQPPGHKLWADLKAHAAGDNRLAGGRGIAAGSPVELLAPDYSPTGFTATVSAVEAGGVLVLDRPLPPEVKAGSVLLDRSHRTANWILRDNYLHDYYGRVMLYAPHGTVTGNRVHRSYYHLGTSTAYFETAGPCRNVVTHGNLFEATNADSSHWGGDRTLPTFHQVTFSANSFVGKGLSLNNAADALVARNYFDGPDATLSVNRCAATQVRDNVRFDRAGGAFAVKGKQNTGLTVEGNVTNPD